MTEPDPWDAVLVRHDDVLGRLPAHVRQGLRDDARAEDLALPPEVRGWLTAAEARDYPGRLVEVRDLAAPAPRFYPIDRGWITPATRGDRSE